MIKSLARGLALTFKTLFRPRITLRYPEQRKAMYERWRGLPYLVQKEDGREACVGCGICARVCPAQVITVKMGKREDNTRYPETYHLDMGRCVFCGFCAESCPYDAIRIGHDYELSTHEKDKLVLSKDDLLRRPE